MESAATASVDETCWTCIWRPNVVESQQIDLVGLSQLRALDL